MIKVKVYSFNMGDVEDPDLWASQKFWEWEQTTEGKWLLENTSNAIWKRIPCEYGWQYDIIADMDDKQYTYYKLKYQ
jgi:hypothetical protein